MDEDAEGAEKHHTTFDTDQNQPNVEVTETVARVKGVESGQLSPLYDCIDHAIDNIFSNPPTPKADVEVTFSYEGFRITIRQDGRATFQRLE